MPAWKSRFSFGLEQRRGEALSSLDVPQHRELRVAVTKHFFPGVARRLEPLARDIARSSLDAV